MEQPSVDRAIQARLCNAHQRQRRRPWLRSGIHAGRRPRRSFVRSRARRSIVVTKFCPSAPKSHAVRRTVLPGYSKRQPLAFGFRAAVHAERRDRIRFHVPPRLRAVENVIGRHVQEAGAASLGGLHEMADTGRVHRERRRRLVLGAIDRGVGRRVHDHRRAKPLDESGHRRFVGDVELLEREPPGPRTAPARARAVARVRAGRRRRKRARESRSRYRREAEPAAVVAAVEDRPPPPFVAEIPAHGLGQAFVETSAWAANRARCGSATRRSHSAGHAPGDPRRSE